MFRDLRQGIINVREQVFTLMATDTKRFIIRDPQGRFIATRPYRMVNGILTSTIVLFLQSMTLVLGRFSSPYI